MRGIYHRFDGILTWYAPMTSLLNWQTTNNIATYLTNQVNNQSTIPLTDVVQLTLTLKMTTAQVVETSVTVNNNSPIQDYVHPDDQTQPTLKVFLLTNFSPACSVFQYKCAAFRTRFLKLYQALFIGHFSEFSKPSHLRQGQVRYLSCDNQFHLHDSCNITFMSKDFALNFIFIRGLRATQK